jgi:hypothetical protein
MWKTFRTTAAGMQSHSDFGLAESRVLVRCEAHVAGEDELTAQAPDTASDLRKSAIDGNLKVELTNYPIADVSKVHTGIEQRKTTGKLVLIP